MPPSSTRRRLLAGAGAATVGALAGCTQRIWPGAGDGPRQVSLSIKTVPVEEDPIASMITSQLVENLERAGVATVREPMDSVALYREIFIEREYDIFVARHPGLDDADRLRSMLHSQFVGEQGWQNPFGFSDPTVDELLEEQLSRSGDERRETLAELVEYLVGTAPYTAIAFPDRLGAASSDLDVSTPPCKPVDYVELLTGRPEDDSLLIGTYGISPTDRLNPIAVDAKRVDAILDLLYDPLVRRVDDELVPWLAETVTWNEPGGVGRRLVAEVELRSGVQWHDGESFDATDVAFTYEFLGDTSLGEAESNVPALRFRGRESLVEDVTVIDAQTLEFVFDGLSRAVAERALTVPILPEHVWDPRSELVGDLWTEALATENADPIGSGLFSLVDASGEVIELEPFDEHVMFTEAVPGFDAPLGDEFGDARVEFRISPGPTAAIDGLLEGDLDLIVDWLTPETLEPVEADPDVSVLARESQSFYVIGYNVQHPQLGNPNFRQIVSQFVDRAHVVDEIFDGHARPATTPSAVVGLPNADLEELVDASVPSFPGVDGEVDEGRARSRFEDASYRYEDGTLMA